MTGMIIVCFIAVIMSYFAGMAVGYLTRQAKDYEIK